MSFSHLAKMARALSAWTEGCSASEWLMSLFSSSNVFVIVLNVYKGPKVYVNLAFFNKLVVGRIFDEAHVSTK